jgi:DNA-binding transcriptional MerR regulator
MRRTRKEFQGMRVLGVAREVGVSKTWLQQKEGDLFPLPRRDRNGHRRYSKEDIAAIRAALYQDRTVSERED